MQWTPSLTRKVSPSRTNIKWIATRKYRSGQVHAKVQQRYNVLKYHQILLLSPAKIAFCASMAAILVVRPIRAMWWLMRGVLHFGHAQLSSEWESASRILIIA